jgi:hypothetical protein
LRATPPRLPPDGEGLINALSERDRYSMRVLSPSILPRVIELDGSIANIAGRRSFSIKNKPNFSINELFPAPGMPVIPMRIEFPEYGNSSRISS